MQVCIAAALVAAIFTRYDGWIIALIAWTGIGLALLTHGGLPLLAPFWLASVAVAAAPLLWFVYNSVGFGDWLYFARGPFSAKAIETAHRRVRRLAAASRLAQSLGRAALLSQSLGA